MEISRVCPDADYREAWCRPRHHSPIVQAPEACPAACVVVHAARWSSSRSVTRTGHGCLS